MSGGDEAGRDTATRGSRSQVRLRGMSALTLARANWRVRLARMTVAGLRDGGRAPGGTTWRRAIQLARRGYFPHADRLYDLERHGWDAYLSDRTHMLTWALDWPFGGLVDEKLVFSFLMRRIGAPTPEVLGVVRRGRALPLDGDRDPLWLERELRSRGALVIKPSTSRGGGAGVQIWQAVDQDSALVNGAPTPVGSIGARVGRMHDALVCEYITPADYSTRVWPTPNTIRIVTIVPESGEPSVIATSHRFGRSGGAVDNFSSGGVMAMIDPGTGVLGRAVHNDRGVPRWSDHHPDSGARIAGIAVPGWASIVAGVRQAAGALPFLPLLGWDVLVTEDGYRLIEANKFPATDWMQVEGPLLERPGVREFLAESGLADGGRAPAPTNVHVRMPGIPSETLARLRWRRKQLWLARRLVRPRAGSFPQGRPAAIRLARAGFMPSSGLLYDPAAPRTDYVTDRQRERTWAINWPFAGILDDKIAFGVMLDALGAPTPPVLAVIRAGRVLGLGDPSRSGDWLLRHLGDGGRLVLRPTRSGAGMGVTVLDGGGDAPTINGRECSWDDVLTRVAGLDDVVVTPFVQQAAYSQRIFRTPNTIRMLTMVDEEDGEAFLAGAVHRFGADRSGPVDNWSQGGVGAAVDTETGVLGRAASVATGRVEWHDHHPDSGAPISGVAIPGWQEVRGAVLELARRVAFLPYVGWDVLVTDDGHQVIEGNKMSDVQLLQVHRPLLRDDRVRSFYERYGVL